jgi:DDE superfamily endonuclease
MVRRRYTVRFHSRAPGREFFRTTRITGAERIARDARQHPLLPLHASARREVDAKPSIQARGRCSPTSPAARGTPVRVEHEYVRHGALALLAALDVHTGKVFAATPDTTGIAPFMDLMSQVMSREYNDAPWVFVIVDNGSDHRGQPAAGRLRDAYPNAIMIHTPVHASWLNQTVQHEVACEEWYPSKGDRLMSVT